jgi:putative RNA 2'-phosphotransferase
MDPKRLVKVSKYLSKHLRHQPERLGLTLAEGGWVAVDVLLDTCARHHFAISMEELREVVVKNDKQRFTLDEAGNRIRANQGHSVEVDLQLETAEPPALLYHGTPEQFLSSVLAEGLKKMARHHVHMSHEMEGPRKVAARRGKPVMLAIDAAGMRRDGFTFFRSANGVWLVDAVPVHYLSVVR